MIQKEILEGMVDGGGDGETDLLLNVVERIRRVDSKTDEDDVRIWVGQRAETIVIFLSSCIPEC